jgi:hypothetical protein
VEDTSKPRFEISYMAWPVFFAALNDPRTHRETWAMFASMDCVIGGIDLEVPYMYVVYSNECRCRTDTSTQGDALYVERRESGSNPFPPR